jgi:hypothetical protein
MVAPAETRRCDSHEWLSDETQPSPFRRRRRLAAAFCDQSSSPELTKFSMPTVASDFFSKFRGV